MPRHQLQGSLEFEIESSGSSKGRCAERMQKGIAYWDKQNNDVPAPNYMLKVREEIIKI